MTAFIRASSVIANRDGGVVAGNLSIASLYSALMMLSWPGQLFSWARLSVLNNVSKSTVVLMPCSVCSLCFMYGSLSCQSAQFSSVTSEWWVSSVKVFVKWSVKICRCSRGS